MGRGAADAYRALRREQHRLRLDEQPTQLELGDGHPLAQARQAVLALWATVFPA